MPAWRNAGTWYDSAANVGYTVSTTPRAKSIAVWVDGGAGYVGYVTGVNGDQIYVKEGGYLGAYHEGYVKASGYRNTTQRLLGYIYIPVDVTYKTQVQSYGWMKPVKNGQIAGTIGQSKEW